MICVSHQHPPIQKPLLTSHASAPGQRSLLLPSLQRCPTSGRRACDLRSGTPGPGLRGKEEPGQYACLEAQGALHRPMTRLLLHIGHPKTGTTALQSVLSANAKSLLQEASVLYPTQTSPVEPKHALAIPWLFRLDNASIRRRARARGDALREISRTYWDSLVREVRQTRHDSLVLSAEGFWSILNRATQEQMAFARDQLCMIADQIQLIGYVRSPAAYFLSRINQKLRNFAPVTLPRPDYYSSAMRRWEEFGFDDYAWRVFDRSLLFKMDIVDDFCANHMPESLRIDRLSRTCIEEPNASVSGEALVILEELAAKYPLLCRDVYDRRRWKIVSILRDADAEVGGSIRPALLESARVAIVNRCRDLGWLRERGISFPDIEATESRHCNAEGLPETYTCVADYCRVDAERLASLRSASRKIETLFQVKHQRFFWPFRRLLHL